MVGMLVLPEPAVGGRLTEADVAAIRAAWPDNPLVQPGGLYGPDPAMMGAESPGPLASAVDPIALAVDLCPFREGCQTCGKVKCLQAGYPAIVTPADCRACQSGPPPSPEPLP